MIISTGSRYYSDSPYGKPNLTVLFSSVRCTGSESRISDCATSSLTFEEGRKLVKHIGVAGVSCIRRQHCLIATPTPAVVTITHIVTSCPTRIIGLEPSQQAQSASSSADSGHQLITTFLLAGISGILATVTITLAIW